MKTSKLNFLALALAAQVLNVPVLEPAQAASWVTTSPLSHARAGHTATLLRDGKVLVAGGGTYSSEFSSAELYDPATGTWTETGALNAGRSSHTLTLLSNGKVLAVGGYPQTQRGLLCSAELYDPLTGVWTTTGALNTNRYTRIPLQESPMQSILTT